MREVMGIAAVLLLLMLLVSLLRVVRGPTAADRMLGAQLMSTTGMGLLLVLGQALRLHAAVDVALVLALLASVAALAFVRRGWLSAGREEAE